MERLFGRLNVNTLKLVHGELPTPEVLNRPWLAMANVMGEIDEAVQTVDKGTSLEATKRTRFLTHCNKSGIDLINGVLPVLPTDVVDGDVFIDDDFFFGAAFATKGQSNLIKNALRELRKATGGTSDSSSEEVITNRCNSSLTSLGGWDTSYSPEAATHLNVSTSQRGLRIKKPLVGTVTTAGTYNLQTPKFPVTHGTKIAYSGYIKAFTNLDFTGVSIKFSMKYLDASELAIASPPQELLINTGIPEGVHGKELLDVPVGAAYAKLLIEVQYAIGTTIDIRIKNIMVSDTYMAPYTRTERPDSFATYKNVVDLYNPGTIVCWTKFRESTSNSQVADTALSPLYLTSASTSNAFMLNRMSSDGPNYTFTGEFANYATGTASDTTAKIALPASIYGKPVMVAYRWDNAGVWGGSTSNLRFEYLILDPDNADVHKVSLEIPYASISHELYEVRVGYLGNDLISTPYSSPVTEIRYDFEYMNDIQIQTFCLSEQPFTIPFDASLIIDILNREVDDAAAAIITPNRIANPSGALSFNGWFGVEPGWEVTYGVDGIGFKWILPNRTDIPRYIVTMPMPCLSNELLVLSTEMRATKGTSGSYGVGLEFYTLADVPIRSIEPSITLVDQQALQRLSVAFRAPSNAAMCRAYLMVDAGTTSTKGIYFHRLKLEAGIKPTEFTDESTPMYSIYF